MATTAVQTPSTFHPFLPTRDSRITGSRKSLPVRDSQPLDFAVREEARNGIAPAPSAADSVSTEPITQPARCLTEEQYGAAYRTGFQRTIRFLRSRGASADIAEEVAQAAWVRGWERLHQLRTPEALEVWVASIAKHMFSAHAIGSQRSEEIEETTAACEPTETGILWNEIVSSCKPEEKKLLSLHYVSGYSSGEIANKLGCSALAVRLRLMRVRRKIDATLPATMLAHAA